MKQLFTLLTVMLFVFALFGTTVNAEPLDGEYSYQYKWDTEYSYLWQYGFLNKFFNKYMYQYFYEGDNGQVPETGDALLVNPDAELDRDRDRDNDGQGADVLRYRLESRDKKQLQDGTCMD